MPRPADGYRNSAGDKVPGVHDITQDLDKPQIAGWAHARGKRGLPLYEPGTFSIGHAVHAMAELDLRGRPRAQIEAEVAKLEHAADRYKAWNAFEAFRQWRAELGVRAIAHEVSIVSDTYNLGGTPDCIAIVDGQIVLIDFKTCNKVPSKPYREQLFAMAAHSTLWNELHPDQKVTAAVIVYLPKDGKPPVHCSLTDIRKYWRPFYRRLQAHQEEFGYPPVQLPPDPRDAEIARLRAELEAQMMVKPKRKPRAPTVAKSPKRAWEDQRNVVAFPGRT